MRALLVAAVLLGTLGAGCGDAAVDGDYRGEPLLTVSGWVRVENLFVDVAGDAVEQGRLRMAVLWAAPDGAGRSRFDVVTSVAERVDASGLFPARYELTLFSPPAARLVQPSGGEGSYAVGVLVAFLDTNDDGRWASGNEQLVGAVMDVALVYSPAGARGPTTATVFGPGYTLASVSDDPATCSDTGQALLYARDRAEADLVVDMAFPYEAALDLDCDGDPTEWVAFCPELWLVDEICSGDPSVGADDELCALCSGFLPPTSAGALACDEWLPTCVDQFPPFECEQVWRSCRGLDESAPCGGEPVCVCETMYAECTQDEGTNGHCEGLRDACLP